MRIAVGCDHAGIALKDAVSAWLLAHDFDVLDVGTNTPESCDYADFANALVDAIQAGDAARGVLICGTGQGMAMTANKRPGIRAAVVADPFSASMATAHNNAQVLCLGARVVGDAVALACVESFLGATFEGGRHQRRIDKLEASAGR